jgi:hypothetical protein
VNSMFTSSPSSFTSDPMRFLHHALIGHTLSARHYQHGSMHTNQGKVKPTHRLYHPPPPPPPNKQSPCP